MKYQESLKARYDPLNHNTRDILAVAFSEQLSPQGSLHVTAGSVARGALLSEDRLSPIRRTRTSRQPGSVAPHVDVDLSDFVSRGRSEEHRRGGARSAGVLGFRPHLPAMRLKRIPARPLQTLKTGDLTGHAAYVIQRDDR